MSPAIYHLSIGVAITMNLVVAIAAASRMPRYMRIPGWRAFLPYLVVMGVLDLVGTILARVIQVPNLWIPALWVMGTFVMVPVALSEWSPRATRSLVVVTILTLALCAAYFTFHTASTSVDVVRIMGPAASLLTGLLGFVCLWHILVVPGAPPFLQNPEAMVVAGISASYLGSVLAVAMLGPGLSSNDHELIRAVWGIKNFGVLPSSFIILRGVLWLPLR